MAKKRTSRISPVVLQTKAKFNSYDYMSNGDAFLWEGALYVKCESYEQEAINMDTGLVIDDMCDKVVEPVDIVVTWKRK